MNKILSIFVYLSFFGLSIFFCYEGEICYNNNCYSKKDTYIKKRVFFFISLLFPCLLAGLRSDNVGVDTGRTVLEFQKISNLESFHQLAIGSNFGEYEYGFALISYIVSRFTKTEEVFLFILQFLVIFPVLLSAIKNRNHSSITMSMTIYLFVFFNNSLNLMRQSISCAFILLGTMYIIDDSKNTWYKYLKVIILFYFSTLFHKSAYIGITIVVFIVLLQNMPAKRSAKIGLHILILCIPFFLSYIASLMVNLGLMNQTMQYYFDIFVFRTIEKDFFSDPFSLYSIVNVGMRLLLLVSCYIVTNRNSEESISYLKEFAISSFLFFTIVLYVIKTSYAHRIILYLDFFLIPMLSFNNIKPNKQNKKIFTIVVLLIYWFIWIIVFGWSGSELYDLRAF